MSDLLEYLESTGLFERLHEHESGKGIEITARCPFASTTHKKGVDRHPSWGINVETGKWHCFSCGEGGKLPDLIKKLDLPGILSADGLLIAPDFKTQLLNFYKKIGTAPEVKSDPDHWPLPSDFNLFRDRYERDNPALEYLYEIGIGYKAIKKFGIGYLSNHDIIYPIGDVEGYQFAWQIRRRNPVGEQTRFQFPSGFKKNHHLYNLHNIQPNDEVIVVEGIKAVIKLWQWNIRHCVSSFSDVFSLEQIALLARMKSITMLFDGDLAGRRGMYGYKDKLDKHVPGALDLLRDNYFGDVYWVELPDQGKNSSPDDFESDFLRSALSARKQMKISKIPNWKFLQDYRP